MKPFCDLPFPMILFWAVTILFVIYILHDIVRKDDIVRKRDKEARHRAHVKQQEWLRTRRYKDGKDYAFKTEGGGMEMGRAPVEEKEEQP